MDATTRAMIETFGEAAATGDPTMVKEAFDSIKRMLGREDRGWVPIAGGGGFGSEEDFGLTLDDLKAWSKKLREPVHGTSWMGRGFRLRANFVWQNGIRYGSIPGANGQGIKGKTNVQNIIDKPGNQFHFFGSEARRGREECLYADGVAFWLGNQATKDLTAIPLRQITDVLREPNGLGYAMAYLREWTEYDWVTGDSKPHKAWIFTDRFVDQRPKRGTIGVKVKGGTSVEKVEIDQKNIIFDLHANKSTGFVFGAPDAIAAWIWYGIAKDGTLDGVSMTRAMATFALKATAKTPDGQATAAISMATPHTAGSTALVGQPTDLVPMSSAGKAYDFEKIDFLVSIVAAALDVSLRQLKADDSGVGNGEILDLPTRRAMEARRDLHIDLDTRVLRWMGADNPDVTFVPFATGDETYRNTQSIVMKLQNDIISRQEARDQMDDLEGRPNGTVPAEAERNSVLLLKQTSKIQGSVTAATDQSKTADGTAKTTVTRTTPADGGTVPQTASPNQGRSNGTLGGQGGGAASNDIRRGSGK